jgi:uncharacterized membrane protein
MRIAFWIGLTALMAIATHLAYVLFVPAQLYQSALGSAVPDLKPNVLVILDQGVQANLLPAYRGNGVSAFCLIDLSSGTVQIDAVLPRSYWSLAIHTEDGLQVYALNDAQAENDNVQIKLSRAKGFFEQVFKANDVDDGIDFSTVGWRVELPGPGGLAIIWVPLPDPFARKEIEAQLQKGSCKTVAG